jgi:TPR repeat protein
MCLLPSRVDCAFMRQGDALGDAFYRSMAIALHVRDPFQLGGRMYRFFVHFTVAAIAMAMALLNAGAAYADVRVALVIGNSAYRNQPALPNPTNDAKDVGAALKRLGFETILATDQDKSGMDDAEIRFARAARNADVALFYYSGHALQFGGVNYLVPVDAQLTDEADLRRMVRVDELVGDLQQAKTLRILVLDSCRSNPFAESLKRSMTATRAVLVERGMARIDAPEGMIVAYSTQSGRVAYDGDDDRSRNSPYTKAFLKEIETQDEIGNIFRQVAADVVDATGHKQLPELSLSMIGKFYLRGVPQLEVKPPDTAAHDFDAAKSLDTVTGWDAFLKQHPEGFYTTLAREWRSRAAAKLEAALSAAPVTALAVPNGDRPGANLADLVTECDRLAGLPFDTQAARPNVGVFPTGRIDAGPAVAACNDAIRQYPAVGRFRFELGRALFAQKDYLRARESFEEAIDKGSVAAMNGMALLYREGLGVTKDDAKANQWIDKAASAGDPAGLGNLGRSYVYGLGGMTQDYARGRSLLERAAAGRDVSAMHLLGEVYERGWGTAVDFGQARQWYEKAAAAGYADSMSALGDLYSAGNGVAQDDTVARQWYEKAAAAGDSAAMLNVGYLYRDGLGVSQDYAIARQWYEKSAAAGNAVAMFSLGRSYENGDGVARDRALARQWYEKAVAAGYSDAKNKLDQMDAMVQPSGIETRVAEFGATIAPANNVPGIVLTQIDPKGVAAERGFKQGDVVLEIAGKTIRSADDMRAAIAAARKDGKNVVLMRVRSGDQSRFIAMPLGKG